LLGEDSVDRRANVVTTSRLQRRGEDMPRPFVGGHIRKQTHPARMGNTATVGGT
jgi:hypothetical protein